MNATGSVYVLGSIHGNMLNQPRNNLRDFITAVVSFRPTVILTEARADFPGPVDAAIDAGGEQALVYAYAKFSKISIQAVDWFDDQFNLSAERESELMHPPLQKKIEPLFQQFRQIVQKGTFFESQLESTQELIRARYEILSREGIGSAGIRNERICDNIKKQLPHFKNARVLIVFGLAHKYYLDDCLKKAGIPPLKLSDWYERRRAVETEIPAAIQAAGILTFESAKATLGRRLRQGYYKTDLPNLNDKLNEFDSWIAETKALKTMN